MYLLISLRKYNVKVAPIYSRLNKSVPPKIKNRLQGDFQDFMCEAQQTASNFHYIRQS
jgi:hypothetical protein